MKNGLFLASTIAAIGMATATVAVPAHAQYRQKIAHDMSKCSGSSPAVMVTITGVSQSSGTMRVQSYRGTKDDWLESGRWINRIEAPARAGTMRFCVPVPAAGVYGIAVRHDVNNNGKTDLSTDGGAMSNNPSLNIWNLGKPSYKKTRFQVGNGVEQITINMRYR